MAEADQRVTPLAVHKSAHGTKLPIRNVRFHGKSCYGIAETTFMTLAA